MGRHRHFAARKRENGILSINVLPDVFLHPLLLSDFISVRVRTWKMPAIVVSQLVPRQVFHGEIVWPSWVSVSPDCEGHWAPWVPSSTAHTKTHMWSCPPTGRSLQQAPLDFSTDYYPQNKFGFSSKQSLLFFSFTFWCSNSSRNLILKITINNYAWAKHLDVFRASGNLVRNEFPSVS